MGGLGNQMFEYAAGLALARRRRTVLKLDTTFYCEHDVDDRHYSLDCLNVPAQFATADEIWALNGKVGRKQELARGVLKALGQKRLADLVTVTGQAHYQKQWRYYPEFHDLPDNTWLSGNYQSEKFFAPVTDILRHQFTFRYPPTPAVEAMAVRIKSGPSVSVHFRRGDYVNHPHFAQTIGTVPEDYYAEAINRMRDRAGGDATYYLFSDDPTGSQSRVAAAVPHVWVQCCGDSNHYDAMRLMSLCDHNIIANSTFSWWAAWLNPKADKMVIAPKRWFADNHHPTDNLFPAGWHVL